MYYINDDVVIKGNFTLTIEAGVQLIFGPDYVSGNNRGYDNKTGIFVEDNGAIIVNGTETDKVTMTALYPSTGWEGISIKGVYNPNNPQNGFNQLPSHINHCIIENVIKEMDGFCWEDKKHGSINLENYNNIIIENSEIKNNTSSFGGGIYIREKTLSISLLNNYPIIRNNEIHDNIAQRGGAILVLLSENQIPYIYNNEIYNNTAEYGGGAIAVLKKSNCRIIGNNIYDNTAECQSLGSIPVQTGGGGIVIGMLSTAEIIGNGIYDNTALFNPFSSDETGLGGGILIRHQGSAIINENEITGNDAENGGGIAVYTRKIHGPPVSNITAEENNISGNIAYNNGGGIAFKHSYGELHFNDIYENAALSEGGGLHIFANRTSDNCINNPVSIFHNKIYSNFGLYGGAIYANGEDYFPSRIYIINNLMHSNNSEYDGACIYFGENWMQIYINNNTITKNSGHINPIGNAIYKPLRHDNSTLSVTNNIMYFNDDDCQIYYPEIRYNEFNFNDIMHLGCQVDPQNNYDLDPEFVDFTNNQFKLMPYSSLINRGDDNVNIIGTLDLEKNPRFADQIDIGAYEIVLNNSFNKTASNSLFPNPASKQITIKSDVITENSIIEIYSADSKLLIKHKSYQNNRAIIEIDKLPNGLYFIKVISENEVFTDKFIKE